MNKQEVQERIQNELTKAEEARRIGNDGMARVCARRAAGAAITYWLAFHPRPEWGIDAMSQLRDLQQDGSMPEVVRDAALRLTTKITDQFTSPFSTDPIEDSKIIIDYLQKA